jgi:FkbM family methyltransferase
MILPLAIARKFHRFFPFSQLRTANWILKTNRNKELSPIRLFGYEVPLRARTSVHVLLSIEGEKWVEDKFLLGPYLREGLVVMDVGANIGYLTLFFCRAVGPRGAVFAFEPDPENFRELAQTVEDNHIEWCTAVNRACGTSDGPAYLATGLNGYIQAGGEDVANCRMMSLDSFIDERKLLTVDLVKIDVEGFEAEVLSGMSGMLKRHRPILYVEVHPPGFCGSGDPRRVCGILKEYYSELHAFRIWGEVRQKLPVWDKVRASFGADHVVRRECETTLDEVMETKHQRYQVLAVPS